MTTNFWARLDLRICNYYTVGIFTLQWLHVVADINLIKGFAFLLLEYKLEYKNIASFYPVYLRVKRKSTKFST